MRSLIRRPRISAITFIAVVGTLLAVMALFTFDRIDSRSQHQTAETGTSAEGDAPDAPAILILRADSTRTQADRIAVTDNTI